MRYFDDGTSRPSIATVPTLQSDDLELLLDTPLFSIGEGKFFLHRVLQLLVSNANYCAQFSKNNAQELQILAHKLQIPQHYYKRASLALIVIQAHLLQRAQNPHENSEQIMKVATTLLDKACENLGNLALPVAVFANIGFAMAYHHNEKLQAYFQFQALEAATRIEQTTSDDSWKLFATHIINQMQCRLQANPGLVADCRMEARQLDAPTHRPVPTF